VHVTLTAHTVTVTNLPPRTGVVTLSFGAGVVFGDPGIVRPSARQPGSRALLYASTPATWLP